MVTNRDAVHADGLGQRNDDDGVDHQHPIVIAPRQEAVNKQNDFDRLYKDLTQPGAFTEKIKRYLRQNVPHSLHKPKRKIFPRRRIITHYPGQIIQSDLIDMQRLTTKNSGFKFILVVIDCFSKKLWTK